MILNHDRNISIEFLCLSDQGILIYSNFFSRSCHCHFYGAGLGQCTSEALGGAALQPSIL